MSYMDFAEQKLKISGGVPGAKFLFALSAASFSTDISGPVVEFDWQKMFFSTVRQNRGVIRYLEYRV